MSRTQTGLSLPFNPVVQPQAAPVDYFHSPIVESPNTNDANQLAQLGSALSQLEPKVADVFNRRFEAYKQNSQLQATRDAATSQIENMKQLRQAVADGKIAESENPWYMAQMEGEIGRTVARKAVVQAWNDYEQTPEVRNSDDLNVVDKFFSDKFDKVIQSEGGNSVWAVGAMDKVLSEGHDQLMQRHVAVRARERVEEREVSAKAEIADLLSGYTKDTEQAAKKGDPQAIAAVTAAKGAMQRKLNDLLLTVNRTQANKWVKEAIIDHSLAMEDPEIARDLMGSLTTEDGKGLLINDADRETLKNLGMRIQDNEVRRIQHQEYLDKYQEEQTANSAMAEINKARSAAKAAGQDFDYNAAITPDQLAKFAPGVQTRLIAMLTQSASFEQQTKGMNDEAKREAMRQKMSDFLNGKLPPEEMPKFTDLMVLAGGYHDLATALSVKQMLQNLRYPAESDPQAAAGLLQDMVDGTYRGSDLVKHINDLTAQGKLSARDNREFAFYALNQSNRDTTGQDRGELEVSLGRVNNLVLTKRMDAFKPDPDDPTKYQREQDSVLIGSASKAKKDFLFAYNSLTQDPAWKTLPVSERQKQIDDLIDSIAKKNGGYTEAESVKATTLRQAKEEQSRQDAIKRAEARKQAAAAAAGPDPNVADYGIKLVQEQGDPALKNVDASVQSALKQSGAQAYQIAPNPDKRRYFGLTPQFQTPELTALVDAQHRYKSDTQIHYPAVAAPGVVLDTPAESQKKSSEMIIQQLADRRQSALVAAQALGNVIQRDDFAGRIKQTAHDINAQGFATAQQTENLRYLWQKLREYSVLRMRAGYSTDEVKQLGGTAYLDVPMFSSPAELEKTGIQVAKQLGLNPQQAGEMMARQRAILERNLNPQ